MSKGTKRTMLVAIILSFISMAIFGLVFYQARTQGERLTEQIETIKEQETQKASYQHLVMLAEQTEADRKEIEQHFLRQNSDSIDLLNRIESMAPEMGVVLKTESLDTIEEKGNNVISPWIKAKFSFSGTRHNVQNFIHVLESLPYVLRVTEIETQAQSTTLWQASVTIQVRMLDHVKK